MQTRNWRLEFLAVELRRESFVNDSSLASDNVVLSGNINEGKAYSKSLGDLMFDIGRIKAKIVVFPILPIVNISSRAFSKGLEADLSSMCASGIYGLRRFIFMR